MSPKKKLHNVTQYKVVEISTVTDEIIEQVLNQWVPQDWQFDQIQFVVREASRRPSMAFVFFTKSATMEDLGHLYEKIKMKPEDEPEPGDTDG
jgi:hypothetical protein